MKASLQRLLLCLVLPGVGGAQHDFTNASVLSNAEDKINMNTRKECVLLTNATQAERYAAGDHLVQAFVVNGVPVLQFEGGELPMNQSAPNSTNSTKICTNVTDIGTPFNDMPVVTYSITGTITYNETRLSYCSQRMSFCRMQTQQALIRFIGLNFSLGEAATITVMNPSDEQADNIYTQLNYILKITTSKQAADMVELLKDSVGNGLNASDSQASNLDTIRKELKESPSNVLVPGLSDSMLEEAATNATSGFTNVGVSILALYLAQPTFTGGLGFPIGEMLISSPELQETLACADGRYLNPLTYSCLPLKVCAAPHKFEDEHCIRALYLLVFFVVLSLLCAAYVAARKEQDLTAIPHVEWNKLICGAPCCSVPCAGMKCWQWFGNCGGLKCTGLRWKRFLPDASCCPKGITSCSCWSQTCVPCMRNFKKQLRAGFKACIHCGGCGNDCCAANCPTCLKKWKKCTKCVGEFADICCNCCCDVDANTAKEQALKSVPSGSNMRASLNPMRSADHIDSMNAKVDLDSASSGGRGSVVGNPMQRSSMMGPMGAREQRTSLGASGGLSPAAPAADVMDREQAADHDASPAPTMV